MPPILVVDDDPNNQRLLSYSLRKAGFDVLLAANGQAGLDLLESSPVNLAIIDLNMPVMDGLTLLRILRQGTKYASLPVIILTASGDDQEMAVAQKLGVTAFFTKPASSRVLVKTVQQILNPEE